MFGSPGRSCLCCACRILDKRHCINKGEHSYYSVHSGSEVCLMPCPLSLHLLALKSPLCLYPESQLFCSSSSQINWTRSFEIPSSLPSLPVFQGFCKLFLYWGREKDLTWKGNSLVPYQASFSPEGSPCPSSDLIWNPFHTAMAGCRTLWLSCLGNNFCLFWVQFSVGLLLFSPLPHSARGAKKLCGVGETKEAVQWVTGEGEERHR